MNDRFEHILREKLRDHPLNPEPADWTAIERSLGLDAGPRRMPLRRWVAAAAVLLLAVWGGSRLWSPVPEPLVEPVSTPAFPPPVKATDRQANQALEAVRNLKNAIDRSSAPHLSPVEVARVRPEPTTVPNRIQSTENQTNTNRSEPAPSRGTPVAVRPRHAAVTAPRRPQTARRTPTGNWALSLFANGMGAVNARESSADRMLLALNGSQNSADPNVAPEAFADVASDYLIQYDNSRSVGLLVAETADWQHARPIGAGFRVRRNLTGRWGLETGLEYNFLSSKRQTSDVLEKQELHYLGLPLALTYTPLRTHKLELYLRGGGTANLNIAGRLTHSVLHTTDRSTANGVLWSVGVNVGAMYRLTPALGLYLEPGVSHRFGLNGQPDSYWSENPTGVTLQVGFRADF